jgi:DNA repair protein RadB
MDKFNQTFLNDLMPDTITTFFGPPASGKSTICFEYISRFIDADKKVIYIDTEGGFSVERLKQINPKINLKNIIVFKPKNFEQQQKTIEDLNKQIKNSKKIALVIIDSLVMLYRLKLEDQAQKINSKLASQLQLLTEISRSFNIPVLITNQMYTHFDTKKNKMVGGSLIEYWSKTIIEIDYTDSDRKFILRKHKHLKEGEEIPFHIENSGIIFNKSRSFNIFRR